MGNRGKSQALARERVRRLARAEKAAVQAGRKPVPHPDDGLTDDQRRRQAATTCGWCDGPIAIKARGRIPKWCSSGCRQRAWEQSRAAASGRSAVQVVERIVEIPVRPIPGVQVARHPRHQEWAPLLAELAKQLRDAGFVYDRDLRSIATSLDEVNAELAARLSRRRG